MLPCAKAGHELLAFINASPTREPRDTLLLTLMASFSRGQMRRKYPARRRLYGNQGA